MAGRISAEVRKAVDMVKRGATVYQAAKDAGVYQSSIHRSKLYLAWRNEQQKKEVNTK